MSELHGLQDYKRQSELLEDQNFKRSNGRVDGPMPPESLASYKSSCSPLHSNAIYLPPNGPPEFRFMTRPPYEPTFGQCLVNVLFSGINPADLKHRSLGIHSTIIGYDYAGTVLATSPGSPFKAGDGIAGCTPTGISRLLAHGTHQSHILAPSDMAFKIPSSMSLADAAGLTIPLRAAIMALYIHLRLPRPWLSGMPGPILIWGGFSVVGQAAIQLAKTSGAHPIYTTASPHNHEALLRLGATRCFDYACPDDTIREIRAAVTEDGVKLTMAFDTIGIPGEKGLETPSGQAHMADYCFDALDSTALQRVVTVMSGGNPCATVLNAMPDWNVDWKLPARGLTIIEPKYMEAEEMLQVLEWVVGNYGLHFKLPRVRVVRWEAAIEDLQRVAEGKSGGEKLVIRHGEVGETGE